MNIAQRAILTVALMLALLIGLFPPWKRQINLRIGANIVRAEAPLGYASIFSPPGPTSTEEIDKKLLLSGKGLELDLGRLTLQYILLLLLTAGSLAALRGIGISRSSVAIASGIVCVAAAAILVTMVNLRGPPPATPKGDIFDQVAAENADKSPANNSSTAASPFAPDSAQPAQ